jgi:hypothetical protein
MKKLALIILLIPALLGAQIYQKAIDLKWEKDLVSFRDSIGKSISKDSSLNSIAKDRFYKISNFLLQNPDVSFIEFGQKFSEGGHGIPTMGLESFNRQNSQEIATYISSSKPRLDVLAAYKGSKYHLEVVRGEIKRIQKISRRSNGKLSFESKEIVISNKRFGSYTGSIQRPVIREGKKYLEILKLLSLY